jgi:YebC/PmpR family DNA-binding regulatory protein
MSGHSKWATIKHKKAAIDAKRGKLFTKLIKDISVAARVGGGDPTGNPRLRLLLEKAKSVNMPGDNTARAIKKGTGDLPGQQYEPFTYEGYGPEGVALIIEVLTDNKNRAISELRHFFSREHGNLGETGSVNWMFERSSVIRLNKNNFTEDQLLEELIDFPIKDISAEEDLFAVSVEPSSSEAVRQKLAQLGAAVKEVELEWEPKNTIPLTPEQEEKVVNFLNKLEELEDVQNVYANLG